MLAARVERLRPESFYVVKHVDKDTSCEYKTKICKVSGIRILT